jgi:hypothetical protein
MGALDHPSFAIDWMGTQATKQSSSFTMVSRLPHVHPRILDFATISDLMVNRRGSSRQQVDGVMEALVLLRQLMLK